MMVGICRMSIYFRRVKVALTKNRYDHSQRFGWAWDRFGVSVLSLVYHSRRTKAEGHRVDLG
jgi:hypothetical protein